MGYTLELIEQIAEHMRALPEIEKTKIEKTRPEAVKLLAKEIKELQKKGYTLDQVASIITEKGIEIKTGTLKAYIQRGKDTQEETKPKARRGKKKELVQTTLPGTDSEKTDGAAKDTVQSTNKDTQPTAGTFTPKPDREDV